MSDYTVNDVREHLLRFNALLENLLNPQSRRLQCNAILNDDRTKERLRADAELAKKLVQVLEARP